MKGNCRFKFTYFSFVPNPKILRKSQPHKISNFFFSLFVSLVSITAIGTLKLINNQINEQINEFQLSLGFKCSDKDRLL